MTSLPSENAKAERKRRAQQFSRERSRRYRDTHRLEEAARQKRKAQVGGGVPPTLTPALAMEFAKLLASGVPPAKAIEYLAPKFYEQATEAKRRAWMTTLARSEAVLTATRELNGGEWHLLDADRRLQLALDKHLAELAHFLYTHDYSRAEGDDARRMDKAAERLLDYLGDNAGDADTPWKRFVSEFMESYDARQQAEKVPSLPATRES